MTNVVQTLEYITFLKGQNALTFGIGHILKAMQLMNDEKYVSRATLCKELELGEGSIRTIIAHLKQVECVNSIKAGTFLLNKGHELVREISKIISNEANIGKTQFLPSEFNYAILLREGAVHIVDGIKQRDYAILCGATGTLTIFYQNGQFLIAMKDSPSTIGDTKLGNTLRKNLRPKNNDVIIIASANSPITAELAAKSSALYTIHNIQTVSNFVL